MGIEPITPTIVSAPATYAIIRDSTLCTIRRNHLGNSPCPHYDFITVYIQVQQEYAIR